MIHVYADNVYHAWNSLVKAVTVDGKRVPPRGFDSLELENVFVEYRSPPSSYVFVSNTRKINPVFHLVELFYFLNGRSDELLSHYISTMGEFSNEDTGRFDGSYGPAIYESLPHVIHQLVQDSASRRAVVPILKYHHLNIDSKDIPCNVLLGFRIRDGKLNMNVTTRSQDLYRGFIYDTLEFQLLQFILANLLDITVGSYVHHIFSLHLYHPDIDDAVKSAQENERSIHKLQIQEDIPILPKFKTARSFWDYSRKMDMVSEIAADKDDGFVLSAGILDRENDDISTAIRYWKARVTAPDYGIYTRWVNWWLEKKESK